MDTIRYIAGVIVLVGLPPGLLLWFAIHPFVKFWRRLGAAKTYVILTGPTVVAMIALYWARNPLLGADLGTRPPLIVVTAVLVLVALKIARQRRKYLTAKILVGVPELSQKDPGELLTEGIYGRIRHPRYAEAVLFVAAYATIANFAGTYALLALTIPTIYLIVVLEERELRVRFGQAYDDYCRRVPRFVPRPRPHQQA